MIIMRAYVAHYVYDSHSISPSLFECCTSHFVIESRQLFDWRSMPNIFNLFAFACIIVTPDAFKYLNQPFQVLSTLIISQELCFIIHAIHSNFFLHKFKSVNSFKGEFIFLLLIFSFEWIAKRVEIQIRIICISIHKDSSDFDNSLASTMQRLLKQLRN